MSVTKKYTGLPGFDIDPETGRFFLVPVNFKAVFGSGSKRKQSTWSTSKKVKENISSQPAKFRKVETGVRKELFKIPVQNQHKGTRDKETKSNTSSPGVCRILTLPSTSNCGGSSKKPLEKKRVIPMKTITKKSEMKLSAIQEAGYPFRQPTTPHLKFATSKENIKTPDSQESVQEFLKLEQLYKTPKINITNESPVSTVCNLFESKMMLHGDKEDFMKKPMSHKEIIAEIRKIAKCNQELAEDCSKKIKEVIDLQVKHEDNFKVIMSLVDKLDGNNDVDTEENADKENSSIRRSLRLQHKSPNQAVSPVMLKSGDLRKSALNKSLANKCQKYQIENPRIQKALDMYNSTKATYSVLLTPKLTRGQLMEASASPSLRNGLSMKVQQQCLMLQDTPARK